LKYEETLKKINALRKGFSNQREKLAKEIEEATIK